MLENHKEPTNAMGLGLAVGFVLALLALGGSVLAQEIEAHKPGVGDMIAFRAGRSDSHDMPAGMQALIARADDPTPSRKTCILDAQTMIAAGGSLIVEASDPDRTAGYRVHWAGGPTSRGPADCGHASDLFISGSDLAALGAAAGGFGVGNAHLPTAELNVTAEAYVQ